MSSRGDKPPIRTLKVLSREDRGESSGDSRRPRRHEVRKEEREKRREREREAEKPVQGPIVLLKRPDSKVLSGGSSSSGGGSGADAKSQESQDSNRSQSSSSGPTLILQRSSKKEQEEQTSTEKGKASGAQPVTEVLKSAYNFPGGHAVTLIDDKLRMSPWRLFDYDANNYSGNMDYLVITAIGRPNVGKSSILSYLAGNEKRFGPRKIFPPRSREEEMNTSIYISKDQIVFIELSSVCNQAATNELIPMVSQQGVLEVSNVTWNLKLVRWALSVSHVILVVGENVFEPNLFQLMQSAEIIHTMDSALGEGSYPEPVYVCNKATLELIDDTAVTDKFQEYFTSVTGRTPRIETNYHVLPNIKYKMEHYRFEHFKNCILEFNRYNRAPFAPEKEGLAKLVQKNTIQDWFQNASRVWDEMGGPGYFSSYVKLLP